MPLLFVIIKFIMKKMIFCSAAFIICLQLKAQKISGLVTDVATKQPITGASVYSHSKSIGAVTDAEGKYQIFTSERGLLELSVSFIGYETVTKTISLTEEDMTLDFELKAFQSLLNPVNVSALRANKTTPVAYSELSKEKIEERNEGRDIPFILKDAPSTVINSDAGTGIGYTGLRIRGSDVSRINVTVNGVPLNDAESHQVFWVNTPDLASSTQSIQIQRGAGTSTNGAGAFGASINLKTNDIRLKPGASVNLAAGSFNTLKTNLQLHTGLLQDKWTIEGRLSRISSDGFIDRAAADLTSYYLSAGYYSPQTSIQLIHFSGTERTYQAWNGIPKAKLNGDEQGIESYIIRNRNEITEQDSINLMTSDSRTYNSYLYENQVDNYAQDHYQLHLNHHFNKSLEAHIALHYTYGRGYFEEFRGSDRLSNYGLNPVVIDDRDTLFTSDLIRRLWLDNDFTGGIYSLEYSKDNINLIFGGSYNEYAGDHFGEIIWAQYTSGSKLGYRYYNSESLKKDWNNYLKINYRFNRFNAFADLQYREVDYSSTGTDKYRSPIFINETFDFFNPKAGLIYSVNDNLKVFLSAAVAQREPVRGDFLKAQTNIEPKSEFMIDYEAGVEYVTIKHLLKANLYYMDYSNQLIQTGQLNDVGTSVRVNAPNSYRLGIELGGGIDVIEWLNTSANIAVCQNRLLNYKEYTPAYNVNFNLIGYDTLSFSSTPISFSPNVILNMELDFSPFNGDLHLIANGKYVSRQYLDNTGDKSKSLDPFQVIDLRIQYGWKTKFAKKIRFNLLVVNLLNEKYEPKGYSYSYSYSGSRITENFYYPMAGTNFMAGVNIDF